MTESLDSTHRGGDLLTIACGATVILWAIAYIGLSPAVDAPPLLMAAIVLAGLLAAGFALGRWTARGISGGVKLGLILGGINFLIVASLQNRDLPDDATLADMLRVVGAGLLWVVGFTIVATSLTTIGLWLAVSTSKRQKIETVRDHTSDVRYPSPMADSRQQIATHDVSWTSWLAFIVAAATVPLLISGGIVTGLEAGLVVPDWLTTFGYPMMFYPLAMMQENPGVYAEHFHRLWGLLVGLSVIILMVHLFRVEKRAWVKALSVVVLLAIIVQGVIGAAWVLDTQLRHIAVGHGIFGQMVFATIACIAAFCSASWLADREPAVTPSASTERQASVALIVALILQLALGALYRHMRREHGDPMEGIHALYTHIFLAAIVAILAIFVGGRAWSKYTNMPALPRLGASLLLLVGAQILFGIAALVVVILGARVEHIPGWEVAFTTLHQATGAILLAVAALIAVWYWRLLKMPELKMPQERQ
jgi:heme a synthase